MTDQGAGTIPHTGIRVAWVDYAKGICIIMVVMMHSTLDYGAAVGQHGWLHHVVDFAKPFRMPDFFLLAGLFLSLSINAPLREYIDRKLVHFAYFYLIWLLIQLSVTEPMLLLNSPAEFLSLFLFAWIEPINTLWFVHMLAIFYMTTRFLRKIPVPVTFVLAASLQIAFSLGWIDTGWSVADRFFDHYIYFFAGYALAPWIFSFASKVTVRPWMAVAGLILWALINSGFTAGGTDQLPGISLALGFLGAAAIVAAGSLLAGHDWASGLRYCGENSIVIYLSFFLPMKITLKLLADTGAVPDVGWASALITGIAVALPLVFHRIVRGSWLNFLYRRPAPFRLQSRQVQVAES